MSRLTKTAPGEQSQDDDEYIRAVTTHGEVKRQNRALLESVRAAHSDGKNWREELNKFLLAYRLTPHSTTGSSPPELLFKRNISTKMPELICIYEEELGASDQSVRDRDVSKETV